MTTTRNVTRRTRAAALSMLVVGVLALAGCAAEGTEPGGGAATGGPASSNAPGGSGTGTGQDGGTGTAPGTDAGAQQGGNVAVVQEEVCGWDSPKISPAANAPTGTEGDLAVVLVGAWQHTHFDKGAGYEPVGDGTDVRYIFPSTERILYCQDVKGATTQAENAADFTLDGQEIVLPAPANGYAVVAWDADSMVWKNHRDGSSYLLQRR